MLYARFPNLAPSCHTARQVSIKSTRPHLIVYIAVGHFDTLSLYKGEKLYLSRNGGTPQPCWIRPECLLNADGFHKIGGISIPFEHANDVNYYAVHKRLNTVLYNKLREKNNTSAKDIIKHIGALKKDVGGPVAGLTCGLRHSARRRLPMAGGGHLGPLSYVYGYRGGVGRRGEGSWPGHH